MVLTTARDCKGLSLVFFLAILSNVSPLDGPLHRSFCFKLVPSHQLTVSLQKIQHSTRIEAIKLETMAKFLSFFMILNLLGPCMGPPGAPQPLDLFPLHLMTVLYVLIVEAAENWFI